MTDELPPPLVPAEADLKDFAFTPIYRARLFGSSFHARATDSEWRAGVTLWLKSWDQVPAGSLPDDDIDLCRLAELGRDLKTWAKIKAGAMRGWGKCSDGRLYHSVVAEVVIEAWERRARASKKGKAGASKRWSTGNAPAMPEPSKPDSTGIAQAMPNDSKGQGQGQGQGQEEQQQSELLLASQAPPNSHSSEALDIPPSLDRRRATRLSADWQLTDELIKIAMEVREKAGLTAIDIGLEAEKFRDYWHAKSGKDATKTDWLATWRNWCRNARGSSAAPLSASPPTPSADDWNRRLGVTRPA